MSMMQIWTWDEDDVCDHGCTYDGSLHTSKEM